MAAITAQQLADQVERLIAWPGDPAVREQAHVLAARIITEIKSEHSSGAAATTATPDPTPRHRKDPSMPPASVPASALRPGDKITHWTDPYGDEHDVRDRHDGPLIFDHVTPGLYGTTRVDCHTRDGRDCIVPVRAGTRLGVAR